MVFAEVSLPVAAVHGAEGYGLALISTDTDDATGDVRERPDLDVLLKAMPSHFHHLPVSQMKASFKLRVCTESTEIKPIESFCHFQLTITPTTEEAECALRSVFKLKLVSFSQRLHTRFLRYYCFEVISPNTVNHTVPQMTFERMQLKLEREI